MLFACSREPSSGVHSIRVRHSIPQPKDIISSTKGIHWQNKLQIEESESTLTTLDRVWSHLATDAVKKNTFIYHPTTQVSNKVTLLQ